MCHDQVWPPQCPGLQQEFAHLLTGGRFIEQGKIRAVPGESNLVEVTKVILVGFLGIKNSKVLLVLHGPGGLMGSGNLASLQGSA